MIEGDAHMLEDAAAYWALAGGRGGECSLDGECITAWVHLESEVAL